MKTIILLLILFGIGQEQPSCSEPSFPISGQEIGSPACSEPGFTTFSWSNPELNRTIASSPTYKAPVFSPFPGNPLKGSKTLHFYGSEGSVAANSEIRGNGVMTTADNNVTTTSVNHAYANTCACGASGAGNTNPKNPPCDCGSWKWNGTQWVHTGNGKCRHFHEQPPDLPTGDVPVIPLLLLLAGVAVFAEHEPCEE